METLGAHIRNILGPYANLVQILSQISKEEDSSKRELLVRFLTEKVDPANLEDNLDHFIKVSHLSEVESIDWRSTKLFEEYSRNNEQLT
jgi:hypothetical protein